MKITTLDESTIQSIGHAFAYYDYDAEHGLIDAFPSREAVAACGGREIGAAARGRAFPPCGCIAELRAEYVRGQAQHLCGESVRGA